MRSTIRINRSSINRAAYYPNVTGDITGSQGNDLSRIGAGDLSASRLFDRVGQGVVVRQLITDSGRTPNLVASSRLQAQATAQNSQATRYDVLLQVNRAYFDVLHAQAVVKVARANRRRPPAAERSGDRTGQEQAQVAARRQLRRCECLAKPSFC